MMALVRAFREALRGLWRTGMVGLISLLTTAASLLLLGVFVQVLAGGYLMVESLRNRVEVEVYLKDGVSRGKALTLAQEIEAMPGVAEVHYIDKDAAAAEFRKMFGSQMLDALSRNPLPTSLRVRLRVGPGMSGRARAIGQALVVRREVESVDVGQSWLDALDRALDVSIWVGALLGGVLCLACAFAVSNTAKLMVLAQREAIEVMWLVGATGALIRTTFLLGGAIQGFSGGVLASVALWLGSAWWVSRLPALLPVDPVYPAVGVIFLGTALGLVGSRASLNRVLNAVTWK